MGRRNCSYSLIGDDEAVQGGYRLVRVAQHTVSQPGMRTRCGRADLPVAGKRDDESAAPNDSACETSSQGPGRTRTVGDSGQVADCWGGSARPHWCGSLQDMCAWGVAVLIIDEIGQHPELNLEVNPDLPRGIFLRELVGKRYACLLVYGTKYMHRVRGYIYICLEAAVFTTVFP